MDSEPKEMRDLSNLVSELFQALRMTNAEAYRVTIGLAASIIMDGGPKESREDRLKDICRQLSDTVGYLQYKEDEDARPKD